MAKPTKYATPICIGVTVVAAIGIAIGLLTTNAIVVIVAMAPAVAYEVYRTEGETTKWASWVMAATLVALLVLVALGVSFDLAEFVGASEQTVAGYEVPLGDIRMVGAALLIVLSAILFTRTRGVYTRWLAVVILVTSFALVYLVAPDSFQELVRSRFDELSG